MLSRIQVSDTSWRVARRDTSETQVLRGMAILLVAVPAAWCLAALAALRVSPLLLVASVSAVVLVAVVMVGVVARWCPALTACRFTLGGPDLAAAEQAVAIYRDITACHPTPAARGSAGLVAWRVVNRAHTHQESQRVWARWPDATTDMVSVQLRQRCTEDQEHDLARLRHLRWNLDPRTASP